jgi:hypothetical protein
LDALGSYETYGGRSKKSEVSQKEKKMNDLMNQLTFEISNLVETYAKRMIDAGVTPDDAFQACEFALAIASDAWVEDGRGDEFEARFGHCPLATPKQTNTSLERETGPSKFLSDEFTMLFDNQYEL